MRGAVQTILTELKSFFGPLSRALEGSHELAALLRRLGYPLSGDDLSGSVESMPLLMAVRNGVSTLAALSEAAEGSALDAGDALALAAAARPLFAALSDIAEPIESFVPAGSTLAQTAGEIPEELIDLLLADYLEGRSPFVLHVLSLLGAYRAEFVPGTRRGLRYTRHRFDWSRVGQLFEDPEGWARDVYGWGVAFDSERAIGQIAGLFRLLGGAPDVRDMSDPQVAALLPHLAGTPAEPRLTLAPLVVHRASNADGFIDSAGEVGLALFPAGGPTPADAGLAVGPYSSGTVAAQIALAPGWSLRVTGELDAVGGAIFIFRPSGTEIRTGIGATALTGAFGIELAIREEEGGKLVFVGEPDSSRVEADSVSLSLGGRASGGEPDFYMAAGVENLSAVINPKGDGLLSALLKSPMTIGAGDLLLGWRQGRGVYFEGGTSFSLTLPVEIEIGPVRIHEIGLGIELRPELAISITTSADLSIGPVFAAADGIGVRAAFIPAVNGLLGKYDLRFGFIPPTGYALSIAAQPLSGGGLVAVNGSEYRGALALNFQKFGFSAFAILNTKLPGGKDGFSLAASIFGSFNVPLGYGFFLTGLGGVIGINRTIDTAKMREVLYAGRLDNLLFPTDPIANAARILEDMAAILPVREGQHLFGPVARISWGQPNLVDIKLGLVLEVGRQVRLLILGGLSSQLPTKDAALVTLTLSFFGEIDFAARKISFDASLEGSRVLSWPVSGDVAIRSGWADGIDHVAAFGGLHPQYPRPSNLPDLRPLSINFGTNNPRITLTAYAAMTLNSLQFGAHADLYASGPKIRFVGRLAAEGYVYFDALIYFNPFAFDVRLGGGLSLLVDGDVVLGLGFDLRLTGPNTFHIDGRVWATVCKIDVGFGISYSWGESQSLPSATADGAAELRKALASGRTLEPLASSRRTAAVSFRQGDDVAPAIDPAGGVRLVQRAVPLGVSLDKIGEARLAGARSFDVKVFEGGNEIQVAPAREKFVRGHFFNLDEGERLRSPAFESHRAGFEFVAEGFGVGLGDAVIEHHAYEVIILPGSGRRSDLAELANHVPLAESFAERFMNAHHEVVARPVETLAVALRPAVPVAERELEFVPVQAFSAAGERRFARVDNVTDARRRARGLDAAAAEGTANPVVAYYVAAGLKAA